MEKIINQDVQVSRKMQKKGRVALCIFILGSISFVALIIPGFTDKLADNYVYILITLYLFLICSFISLILAISLMVKDREQIGKFSWRGATPLVLIIVSLFVWALIYFFLVLVK